MNAWTSVLAASCVSDVSTGQSWWLGADGRNQSDRGPPRVLTCYE